MRILQVNTIYGSKSTGRICAEMERALIGLGHECFTAFGHGSPVDNPQTYRINTPLEYHVHNVMSRLTGLEGYFSWFATRRLVRYIRRLGPDVIHLGNLHGHYLHLPSLFRFLRDAGIPVVLTLHDCWIFTGKCAHYTARGCYRWKQECSACPALRQYPTSWLFDFTKKMRADKERWLRGLSSLTVVGVSDWVSDQARQSFLKDREIVRIYNWIDRETFRPRQGILPQELARHSTEALILGVSADWKEGMARFDDFMLLADMVDDDTRVVLVGNAERRIDHPRIVHIPFVASAETLATIYTAADVYVHMSVEDTFGKVIAEAMACGTPVVAYDSTACGEVVGSACGAVVPPRDVDAAYRAAQILISTEQSTMAAVCMSEVAGRFDYTDNVKMLVDLYEKVAR